MTDDNQKSKENQAGKIKSIIERLEAAGFKHVQKTGAVLIPVSKNQRESIEKNKKRE